MTSAPLSILQVITQRRFSGAERISLAICEGLQHRGHQVTLLCKHNGNMPQIAASKGIKTLTPNISGKLNFLAPFKIARIAKELKADIIHTHLSTAALWGCIAARIAGIPSVAHVHAMNSRFCYSFADHIISCSGGVKQHLVLQGIAPPNISVAYNGIDMSRFEGLTDKTIMRQEFGIPPDVPIIGCIAHLSEKKGQKFLLQAVSILKSAHPDLHCLLVGEGGMVDELRGMANQLGILERVHLLGFRSDATSIMNIMDIAILPSIAKEGFGLVLVEAGLLGKPVIASNALGIDEAVSDGVTGILTTPGDASSIAEAIDRLLSDDELRKKMGEAGRWRGEELFTISAMTDAIEETYYKLLGR